MSTACFMHGDTTTGETVFFVPNTEVTEEGLSRDVFYPWIIALIDDKQI